MLARLPRIAGAALMLGLASCGPWQRVGDERPPDPGVVVPRLFDATATYRRMGFMAQGPPLPFVSAVRYLASSSPDTTLAVFAVSLANNALSFRRAGQVFEAAYRVEATVRQAGEPVGQIASDRLVRVANFSETQRADESVIFQQLLALPPGDLPVTILIRDRNKQTFNRDSMVLKVPRFDGRPAFSSIIPVYRGTPRTELAALPDLLTNPRATTPYGADTLWLYLEAYGLAPGTDATLEAFDERDNRVWHAVAHFESGSGVASSMVRVEPGTLPLGDLRVVAATSDGADTARIRVLVSLSDQWIVTNLDEILSLLRYFGRDVEVRGMREAQPSERSDLWRRFWRDTDPNPVTPENEALIEYFQRLQTANQRFPESGDPGWLTDRGEVYITLGEPDEVLDQSSSLQGQRRMIRWSYTSDRLQLDFIDDGGFGRFRLTPSSRAEYQRVLSRIRRIP